jgi:hypothetical protein
MRNFAWTGVYAFSAASTLCRVYGDSASFLVNAQRFRRANCNAGIVLTLSTKVWELCARNKHEHADSRGFRPDLVLMTQRTGNFTFSAPATL